MPVDVAGRTQIIVNRYQVSTADTTRPTNSDHMSAVDVPPEYRGGICHCLVLLEASTLIGGHSARVAVFGKPNIPSISGRSADSDIFYLLWRLNNGNAITQQVTSTLPLNTTFYAESLGHVTAYNKLTAVITSMTLIEYVTVAFMFESP